MIRLRRHRPRRPARRRPRRGVGALVAPVRADRGARATSGRALLALRRRAVLARARRPGEPGPRPHGLRAARATARSDDARAHLDDARGRLRGGARALCLADPDGTASSCCPYRRGRRPPAAARPALDARAARRAAAQARPRQLPHRPHPASVAVLRRRARDGASPTGWATAGRLVPRQLRPPRDGAGRHAATPTSTTSPSTWSTSGRCAIVLDHLARHGRWLGLGAGAARHRPATSRATSGSSRSRASSSSTATWSSSSPTTSRASGRTTATRRTRGGRCRRAPTSASTRWRSVRAREPRDARPVRCRR